VDTAFEQVMRHCAEKTPDRNETWINARIIKLYGHLHKTGCCHSVEAWRDGALVGGLYGVRLGAVFFGESMFARATDASKVALAHLVARLNFGGFKLLDAQFLNAHLEQFGCFTIPKARYRPILDAALDQDADFYAFTADHDAEAVIALAAKA
jgi:leucyl/phenylalanyl-tRNA--protein transferase